METTTTISIDDRSEGTSFEYASTAPTTPEGSVAFSPVLRPRDASQQIPEEPTPLVGAHRRSLSSVVLASRAVPTVRNICCVGAGYVGGPTAAVIAFHNPHIKVTVVDRDEKRIKRWNSKHPPIYEPGLGDIVRVARDGTKECRFLNNPIQEGIFDTLSDASTISSECESQCGGHEDETITISARSANLFFSSDVARGIGEADMVLIAVNTPTKSKGAGAGSATDMTAFEAVTAVVARYAQRQAFIVEKSTVPCKTAELVRETMAAYRPNADFEVLSNPEFLAAGTAVNDLLHPDRVLIGSSPTSNGHAAATALADVYAAWVPRSRIITTNVWSSELAKLVANSMLAQRISSINSISAICEKTGADIDEVATSIGCDPRIGNKFLKAGIGFGGSCFKKDVLSLVYLAESLGLAEVGEYWRQVVRMNEYQRDRFAQRVVRALNNTLVGKKITLLGYAFKKDTSDTRESPALEIIKTFLEEGPKEIAIFDPCCNPSVVEEEIRTLVQGKVALKQDGGPIVVHSNAYEACNSSNAVLIATEFDEFRNTGSVPGRTLFKSATEVDPRPFGRVDPTETDVLNLHNFLKSSVSLPAPSRLRGPDPLQRFNAEPNCALDCPDCKQEAAGYSPTCSTSDARPKEKLDWSKVSYHMKKPKWLFDGRGVIDIKEMNKLGVRVETLGRQAKTPRARIDHEI